MYKVKKETKKNILDNIYVENMSYWEKNNKYFADSACLFRQSPPCQKNSENS